MVTLNGIRFTVPCNLIVQLPANTLTWAQFVHGVGGTSRLPVKGLELRVVGNIVGARHLAALAYASQQSLDVATGQITGFDYAHGSMTVSDGAGASTTVQINDPVVAGLLDGSGHPTGRFSAGQSPDARFSVDQDNPTIHAATGYPMCIPRTDPTQAGGDDPLCPQQNRPPAPPVPNPTGVPACRLFGAAGVALPASGELSPPATGQKFCSQFVAPAPPAGNATTTGVDARQQAPFEIGDWVSYSGTLVHAAAGDYVSAHTIEANLGIYTQPGTQPAYVAIGEFGLGTVDPNAAAAANGAAQEATDRLFLEAETTDVKTPVDIYYLDSRPDGTVFNRWVTPTEMTGENATPASGPTGGITTQDSGPQPQRARIRANKAPDGVLSSPGRTVRVAQRTLCLPTPVDVSTTTAGQAALDACFENAPRVANALKAGQYTAPVFEYIFPENVKPGDVLVPNDLWHLPFLRNGEGAGHTGPLTPAPW